MIEAILRRHDLALVVGLFPLHKKPADPQVYSLFPLPAVDSLPLATIGAPVGLGDIHGAIWPGPSQSFR